MRVPDNKNDNSTRSKFLASAVKDRDVILLADLLASLKLMPGLQAHNILDEADTSLAPKDRLFLQVIFDNWHMKSELA